MIPKYISDWLLIIEQMNNDNTYKLAWGRAIIECVSMNDYIDLNDNIEIPFDNISLKMIKYYWNQMFFFNLKQSPYKYKNPVICNDVDKLIEEYKKITESNIPVWFNEGIEVIIKNNKPLYNNIVKHVSKTLHENVCWRFKMVNKESIEIYEYSKSVGSKIILNKDNAKLLKSEEYGIVISKLLNYKCTQLLEKFNFAPKIATKVNGISENKLRRNSLQKYKEILLKEHNGVAIDFYTGKELDDNDISVDHVIPWSFMYSDDIWNLVLTSKSYNSSKSNSVPQTEIIEKLKIRNEQLIEIVDGKFKDDLKLAIDNGYVDKFYYDCRL